MERSWRHVCALECVRLWVTICPWGSRVKGAPLVSSLGEKFPQEQRFSSSLPPCSLSAAVPESTSEAAPLRLQNHAAGDEFTRRVADPTVQSGPRTRQGGHLAGRPHQPNSAGRTVQAAGAGSVTAVTAPSKGSSLMLHMPTRQSRGLFSEGETGRPGCAGGSCCPCVSPHLGVALPLCPAPPHTPGSAFSGVLERCAGLLPALSVCLPLPHFGPGETLVSAEPRHASEEACSSCPDS